jgi:hypothetical protein
MSAVRRLLQTLREALTPRPAPVPIPVRARHPRG